MRKEGVTAPLARVLLNHIPDMATRGEGHGGGGEGRKGEGEEGAGGGGREGRSGAYHVGAQIVRGLRRATTTKQEITTGSSTWRLFCLDTPGDRRNGKGKEGESGRGRAGRRGKGKEVGDERERGLLFTSTVKRLNTRGRKARGAAHGDGARITSWRRRR